MDRKKRIILFYDNDNMVNINGTNMVSIKENGGMHFTPVDTICSMPFYVELSCCIDGVRKTF